MSVQFAIILSAVAAGIFAAINIHQQRSLARRRATLDLIFRGEDKEYRELANSYFTIRASKAGLIAYARKPEELDPDEREKMLIIDSYLNSLELVALGIKEDIFDKEIYKNWMGSAVVNDWNEAREYISKTRQIASHYSDVFCELEALAKEWGGKPIENSNLDTNLKSD